MTDRHKDGNDQEEVGLYEKIAAKTAELLEESRRTIDDALSKAKAEVAKAGDYSSEQLDRASTFVKRDVTDQAKRASGAVQQAVDPQRMTAGVQSVAARILAGAADALTDLAEKAERSLEFKTGDVTSAGTLTCKACGAEMHLRRTSRIPPCARCYQTLFRKSY